MALRTLSTIFLITEHTPMRPTPMGILHFIWLLCKGTSILPKSSLKANPEGLEMGDESGDTPLHMATRWGEEDAVKFLLEKGAKAEAQNSDGNTPMHLAAKNDQ
ncbi:hypothetical protein N7493_010944 [Penicillium malachiteum]|uniref:Ankyrin repeat protein n=1 Tax=Penicillium malachiteum TaxID=1324776 RepID=A0AAD6MQN5_9EURO|nr:hypothetical protein N7493_010944 [Penicillium malachiteum]